MRSRKLLRKISLGHNAVPAKAKSLIYEVLKSGQFSPGPKVKEFEEKLARLHGAKNAVFVNSGTDALRLGLLALKERFQWQDGDLVAVPAVTFVATVNVILQAGLKPLFIDVAPLDYCLDANHLARIMCNDENRRLRAVMPVHLFGQACRREIFDLAMEWNLKVLEDSCETILNPIRGDISCHSTYMAHHLTTGVGGFALTNDFALNLLMRSFANHGRNASYLPGYFKPDLGRNLLQSRFRFDRIGYSCRGTEFEAALGLSQLDSLEVNVAKRKKIANALWNGLVEHKALRLPGSFDRHSWMMFPIVLREGCGIDKYDLCMHLEKAGIETREMMPITNQLCYEGMVKPSDFIVADWINKCGFYIPCHPGIGPEDIKSILKAFGRFFKKGGSERHLTK